MADDQDVLETPSVSEGSEVVSEDVKTPPAEETASQPKSEEKTVPYSRFKEVNDKLAAYEASKEKEQKPEALPKEDLWETTGNPLESVRLGKALKDNTEEETEFIIRNAKTKDVDGIIAASKDPWVVAAIQATREKVAKEKAVPSPNSPSGGSRTFDAAKAVEEGGELAEMERRMKELDKGESEGI